MTGSASCAASGWSRERTTSTSRSPRSAASHCAAATTSPARCGQPKDSEKYYGLLRVEAVNGVDPEVARRRPNFEELTPIFPDDMMKLETDSSELSQRIVDLFAPVGRGQRGLIVSPPKAGKTMLLKSIAPRRRSQQP